MSTFILPLADTKATLETVGGKGLSLAKMIQAGFPIPCGFHLTTEAYRAFIEANGVQAKILAALKDVDTALPATLEFASRAIGGFFAHAAIPSEIADSICNTYLTLNTLHLIPVAVRSSATAEDLPDRIESRQTVSLSPEFFLVAFYILQFSPNPKVSLPQ